MTAWVAGRKRSLQEVMWGCAGIVRRTAELMVAQDVLFGITSEVHAARSQYGVRTDLVELQNMVGVAEMVVGCALMRHESRGLHYILDYPHSVDSERRNSVYRPPSLVPVMPAQYVTTPGQLVAGMRSQRLVTRGQQRRSTKQSLGRDLSVRSTPNNLS